MYLCDKRIKVVFSLFHFNCHILSFFSPHFIAMTRSAMGKLNNNIILEKKPNSRSVFTLPIEYPPPSSIITYVTQANTVNVNMLAILMLERTSALFLGSSNIITFPTYLHIFGSLKGCGQRKKRHSSRLVRTDQLVKIVMFIFFSVFYDPIVL